MRTCCWKTCAAPRTSWPERFTTCCRKPESRPSPSLRGISLECAATALTGLPRLAFESEARAFEFSAIDGGADDAHVRRLVLGKSVSLPGFLEWTGRIEDFEPAIVKALDLGVEQPP